MPTEQPKKKRQHYVPRLILREFSRDRATTSVLVLDTGEVVEGASISRQCYEHYFYGEDGKVENALADVEAAFSAVLGDRSPARLDALSDADTVVIGFFVQLQRGRTVAAAEQMSEQTDSFWKAALGGDPRLLELGPDLDQFRIGTDRPQAEALYFAAMTWPLLLDLKLKFLVPSGKLGFVVSDDPVIIYNQYAEHHPIYRMHPGTSGLALKGLQVFLPLSPRLCIAMYDAGAYECGSPSRRTCSVGLRDVRLLNTLQALNAQECLYFDKSLMAADDLPELVKARRKLQGWRKALIYQSEEIPKADDTTSQIIGLTQPGVRVGTQFGFVVVRDKGSQDDPPKLPSRSKEVLRVAREHAEQMSAWRQAAEEALRNNSADRSAVGDVPTS
jgi:hypothetical protein